MNWTVFPRGLATLALAAAALAGAAPAAHAAPRTIVPGTLTVCASTAFRPVLYRDGQQLVGSDVVFLRAFAKSRNLELAFRDFPFDGIWLRPGRGECDLAAAGITDFASRHSAGVEWSKPYFTVLRTLLIRREQAGTLRTIADFPGRSIGFVTNSSADRDVRARAPQGAVLKGYGEAEAGIADLIAGRLDAFAEGSVTSDDFAARHPELAVIDAHSLVPAEGLAYPVRAESGLLETLDAFIAANAATYGK
ncbi:amino acid ABC transporter substrate-binding protein [Allostella sp. ATCC 35155]|nr:amino acid ABC transporter substrate-binding protein [Stella sp. ATCC 35155]